MRIHLVINKCSLMNINGFTANNNVYNFIWPSNNHHHRQHELPKGLFKNNLIHQLFLNNWLVWEILSDIECCIRMLINCSYSNLLTGLYHLRILEVTVRFRRSGLSQSWITPTCCVIRVLPVLNKLIGCNTNRELGIKISGFIACCSQTKSPGHSAPDLNISSSRRSTPLSSSHQRLQCGCIVCTILSNPYSATDRLVRLIIVQPIRLIVSSGKSMVTRAISLLQYFCTLSPCRFLTT